MIHCIAVSSVNVFLQDNSSSANAIAGPVAISGNTVTIPPASLCINMYDGVYQMTGSFNDVSNAAFTGIFPQQLSLITTSPNTVYVVNDDLGLDAPGYLFGNSTTSTYYGSFGLNVSFDVVTNAVNDVHNYYGDPVYPATGVGNPALGSGPPAYAAANSRRAVLDPTGVNSYDPATKVIRIKYFMYQPTVVPVGPRSFFHETWTYIGPR